MPCLDVSCIAFLLVTPGDDSNDCRDQQWRHQHGGQHERVEMAAIKQAKYAQKPNEP